MRAIRVALIGAMTSALLCGGAVAADLLEPITDVEDAVDSSWDGLYVGLTIDAGHWSGPIPENTIGAGIVVGANFTAEQFLFGVEGFLDAYAGDVLSGGWFAGGEVRAGVLATDSVLVYASLGDIVYSGGANYVTAGAGVEFIASDNLSLDFEGKFHDQTNGPYTAISLTGQALWHF